MDAYLILENGKVFKGKSFGSVKETVAEVVFNTAVTGYIETLTDPSYYGQAIVQTFPLIGNYGIISADFESDKIHASAYIVKDYCKNPSNFRCESDIDSFLKKNGIPGIYGIDTRALTKIIRENGVMNGAICYSPDFDIKKIKSYSIKNAVESVSCKKKTVYKADKSYRNVVLVDFGEKRNIVRCLNDRNCKVTLVPYSINAEEIMKLKPDGVMLSNGPGDPAVNKKVISEVKKLIKTNIPIFGICLGHQIAALAMGFETEKLKYGHRGANQPVINCLDNKIFITSQNHGYAVKKDSIDFNIAEELFRNVNDGTNEGLRYKNHKIITVQFHPEACGGPQDTSFLFDNFIKMMEENKNASK